MGNLEKYLPILIKDAQTENEKQYAVLSSLKLIISLTVFEKEKSKQTEKFLEEILKLLSKIKIEEMLTRNVVSECYGKLLFLSPERVFNEISQNLKSQNFSLKCCLVNCLKFVRFDLENHSLFDLLKSNIHLFFALLSDSNVSVRASVLSSFNYLSAKSPSLVHSFLLMSHNFFPLFYDQTIVKQDLIRTIGIFIFIFYFYFILILIF